LRPYLSASFNGIRGENIAKQERSSEMSRTNAFISILMVLILIALSGVSVWAAPNPDEEFISGVVEGIEIVTEVNQETGETTTTVLVTLALVDETTNEPTGETQTVSLSLATAIDLGLVSENTEQPVEIPEDVIEEDEEEGEEPTEHPVASALANYFASLIPELDYDTIMARHEDGFGFGVIAQACFMSYALEGNAELLGDILDAKKGHDFSSIELPDGETPTNWGQFKKAVLGSEKAHKNLGAIMSGRDKGEQDETGDEDELGTTSTEGKVKDKKGKGPGENGPPGQNKDKGGGKPDTPPGKENKGGGKGGGKKK
jgi:hypothetical protein